MGLRERVMNIVADFLGDKVNGLYLKHDDEPGESYDFDGDQDIIVYYDQENPIYLDDIVDGKYMWNTGASKLAIIPREEDFVIKMPFTHTYDIDAEGLLHIFGETNYDIICAEDNIYEEASDEMKELLVPNKFIGMYCGIPIYIQKKVDIIRDHCYSQYREYLFPESNAASKLVEYLLKKMYVPLDRGPLTFILHRLGIKKFRELMIEVDKIDDLHSNNWGFRKDGSIAIYDYAGFNTKELFYN